MANTARSISPDAIAALENGNKVEAIKHIRIGNNLSLKEAKELIDTYVEKPARMDAPIADTPIADKRQIKINDTGKLIIAVVVVGIYYFIAGRV